MSDRPYMLPRQVPTSTTLVSDAKRDCEIVYPASDRGYQAVAQTVAAAIGRRTGVRPALCCDTSIIDRRDASLPERYRERALIVLGSLNTNLLLRPLYARFFCATDAAFPGQGGYDLRTMVNPYGTGVNSILAGGSTLAGVERAAERLIACVDDLGRPGELSLPFMLDVHLGPDMARKMAAWPDPAYKVSGDIPSDTKRPCLLGDWPESAQDVSVPQTEGALLSLIGPYAILYAWTGQRKYGEYAARCLRTLNERTGESYGDWHYAIERIVRALPWLAAGGFLSEHELLRSDQLLLGTALETQNMWWRKRDGQPPLGNRHLGKGTYAFYLQACYLRHQARGNEAARRLCDRWICECQTYLDALARARADDQDDESSLNNLTTLLWYALGEERFEFFESGNARRCAERAIAVHDNTGAGAGIEGYGEAMPGAMYLQQDIQAMVGAATLYYHDAELKWVWDHLRNLQVPTRMILWVLSPAFMHRFQPGPEVDAQRPARLAGLQVLPLSDYQVDVTTHPPEFRPPMGISIEEPEKWEYHNGLRPNRLPAERTFDKLVLRKGFEPEDPYLLLQGYSEPFRWQGSMHAANAIVRYSQGGHIFLLHNTDRQAYYHKNGVYVSDGYDRDGLPPLAEMVAADDFAAVALSATRVGDAHHADWTRHLFWSKAGEGFFVVLDTLVPLQKGPFSFTCSWRTPGYAALEGRRWQARQGEHVFTLCASRMLKMTSEEQGVQGAVNPYVLRQVQEGEYSPGEVVSFQNLFYARKEPEGLSLDLLYLEPRQVLVVDADGLPMACCLAGAYDGLDEGLSVQAASLMVSPTELWAAGARRLAMPSGSSIEIVSDRRVGVELDLAGHALHVRCDGPYSAGARVLVTLPGRSFTLDLESTGRKTSRLPAAACDAMMAWVERWLAMLARRGRRVDPPQPPAWPGDAWSRGWRFEGWTKGASRVRDVVVSATPAPVDGFAEQLTDTMLPEWRDCISQWPAASRYDIQLQLPRQTAIDSLRIVGDSYRQPILRTFRPLPQRVDVGLSPDQNPEHLRSCNGQVRRGMLRHQRWHGWADRFETLEVQISASAQRVRVSIPAATDGSPLVCQEITLYEERRAMPPVRQLMAVDLDGDGRVEVLAIGSADDCSATGDVASEIVVLDDDGYERWRWQSSSLITHVSCHDLDGTGRLQVCVGLLGPDLVILEPDGSPRLERSFAGYNEEGHDNCFGWLYGIEGLTIWQRGPDGRGALAIGSYGLQVFLDPDCRPVGHCWAGGGAWQSDLLACPPGRVWPKNLWVRNRWHQGICIYEGEAGLEPSGEYVVFGGLRQSMFRRLHKMLSFVNGSTVAFEWIDGSESAGGLILVAAETGVGVASFTDEDWLWKNESGGPITACAVAPARGHHPAQVLVGNAGGFVAAFGETSGRPCRRLLAGAPVVGLAHWPSSGWTAVATREGVLALDGEWRVRSYHAAAVRRMCSLGAGRVVVAREDGVLERLSCLDAESEGIC